MQENFGIIGSKFYVFIRREQAYKCSQIENTSYFLIFLNNTSANNLKRRITKTHCSAFQYSLSTLEYVSLKDSKYISIFVFRIQAYKLSGTCILFSIVYLAFSSRNPCIVPGNLEFHSETSLRNS